MHCFGAVADWEFGSGVVVDLGAVVTVAVALGPLAVPDA
jgi:hypothetical protein